MQVEELLDNYQGIGVELKERPALQAKLEAARQWAQAAAQALTGLCPEDAASLSELQVKLLPWSASGPVRACLHEWLAWSHCLALDC